MKNNIKGLSLTELLVASALIGIVMLGVVGFNVAITTMQNTTMSATSGAISAATAISILRRDIQEAIGDSNNPGILESHPNGSTEHLLAIRTENGNPPTPDDYSDDNWTCWSATDADPVLRRNFQPVYFQNNRPNPPNSNFTLDNCTQSLRSQQVNIPLSDSDFFSIQPNATGGISSVELTISTLANPDEDPDPLTNPVTVLTTKINPLMHSD